MNNNKKKDEPKIKTVKLEKATESKKINYWSLFKYPSIRYRFILLNILWIATKICFNGVAISSKSFKGNFYVNIIVLFIFESVAYFVAGILINIKKLGRRGTLWILYIIVIIALILLAFLNLNIAASSTLNYIARFCCAGIDVIYYTYTTELYPTSIRSLAFGINNGFGNVGGIAAPYLVEFLKSWQCSILFAALFISNAIIIIFFTETVGKPMVESIKELENEKENIKESEIEIPTLNIVDINIDEIKEKEEKESSINMIENPINEKS